MEILSIVVDEKKHILVGVKNFIRRVIQNKCWILQYIIQGEDGNKFQFYMTGAALNVKRFMKAITKGIEIPRKTTMAYKT